MYFGSDSNDWQNVPCGNDTTMTTSLGDIVVVETMASRLHATKYCESIDGMLAPLYDPDDLKRLAERLVDCYRPTGRGNGRLRRFVQSYRVGFRAAEGSAAFSNGVLYSEEEHGEAFLPILRPKLSGACEYARFVPLNEKLLAFDCDEYPDSMKFLCLVPSGNHRWYDGVGRRLYQRGHRDRVDLSDAFINYMVPTALIMALISFVLYFFTMWLRNRQRKVKSDKDDWSF